MNALGRRLADCPLVILIVYTVPDDAEARGYAAWLERVDNPFFNARPGVAHYANWRLGAVVRGEAPGWDWFDFQGLAREEDLERVWFDRELDAFRAEWIRTWGYGRREPRLAEVLAHAYVMRPVGRPGSTAAAERASFVAGRGTPPVADTMFRVEAVLAKHFAAAPGATRPDGWCRPAVDAAPLGFDWVGLVADAAAAPAAANLVAAAERVAAPDRPTTRG